MGIIEIILLSVGLAMDAFAVSISNGLSMKKILLRKALLIAGAFGLFQGLMPLLGFLLGSSFARFIGEWDHYIALIFLGFIGGKMIFDGISEIRHPEKNKDDGKQLSLISLLFQAIATSIDALVVGVSFATVGVDIVDTGWSFCAINLNLWAAIGIIAAITFVISLLGVFMGKKFGEFLGSKAVIFGGIILVGLGIKIFVEHMFFA